MDTQQFFQSIIPILFPLLIWSSVWKGIALWKSARLGSKGWFIALFILNTVGILEIIYIFAIAKKKELVPQNPQASV
ncbi:MAG TPA: hypothetical protein DCY49_03355 [Candidatus Jacksonbacteria bacterium]|uniref:DUF5652 domain-containing protein n=1 Tax=candidate division CPR1 bacterium GW2011_GWA2_42_17 TaxID=1618341 RepID=A0A0G0Z6I6_9BACT|nr:MAG: hypothetical protein UV05_C0007G0007 [candidate division CPR1 bacterium GW2011_GWA2_42_17]OGY71020.1 MAG: hypothetical protein A2986_00900 [Candidatus Jacksonbacteria bacterium RIFCSPLOWO2_01_FULL_44_13]HAZ16913.1 hypothetical protein [Candidatus Jacksonbacteria bacterium]